MLGVWVENQGSSDPYEGYTTTPFVVSSYADTPCSGGDGNLSPSPSGAAQVGDTVTLTMSATCSGTAEYQFWMAAPGADWTIVQDYATDDSSMSPNSYSWDTTGLTAGEYQVGVWVRNQGSSSDYETYDLQVYTLATSTCADVNSTVGCCTGNDLYYCNSSMDPAPMQADCAANPDFPVCGWNASAGYYDCVAAPSTSDPSDIYPLACP